MNDNKFGFGIVPVNPPATDNKMVYLVARYPTLAAAKREADRINAAVDTVNGWLTETITGVRVIRWWTPEPYASFDAVDAAETLE